MRVYSFHAMYILIRVHCTFAHFGVYYYIIGQSLEIHHFVSCSLYMRALIMKLYEVPYNLYCSCNALQCGLAHFGVGPSLENYTWSPLYVIMH